MYQEKLEDYFGDIAIWLDSDENVKLRDEVFEKQKQLFEDAGDGHMLKVDVEKERMKLV